MSKWDKLLTRICALSRDLRFDELAVITHSEKPDASRLRYRSMNPLKRYM